MNNHAPILEFIPPLRGGFRAFKHDYPQQYTGWHHHPEYELHLINKTEGLCFVGSYMAKFKKGNLILVGPHLPHMWISQPKAEQVIENRDYVFQFSEGFAQNCLKLIDDDNHKLAMLFRKAEFGLQFNDLTSQNIQPAMEKLLRKQTRLEALKNIFHIFHILTKENNPLCLSIASSTGEVTAKNHAPDSRIRKAIQFISQNYTDSEISCNYIAQHVHMDASSFSRLFKKHTTLSCILYITKLRIFKACELLSNTDRSVSTICFAVGYASLSSFNRAFKSIMKMSPKSFRGQRSLSQNNITIHHL